MMVLLLTIYLLYKQYILRSFLTLFPQRFSLWMIWHFQISRLKSRGKWRRIHSNLYSWHLQSLQLYKIVFPWYYHIYWNGIINHFILELNRAFWTFDTENGSAFFLDFFSSIYSYFLGGFSFLCQCIVACPKMQQLLKCWAP